MIKYNPNELQIMLFDKEMNKISKKQASIEHEKLRCSLIHKANDDLFHNLLDTRPNAAKINYEEI
jgi:hypothetical protein